MLPIITKFNKHQIFSFKNRIIQSILNIKDINKSVFSIELY